MVKPSKRIISKYPPSKEKSVSEAIQSPVDETTQAAASAAPVTEVVEVTAATAVADQAAPEVTEAKPADEAAQADKQEAPATSSDAEEQTPPADEQAPQDTAEVIEKIEEPAPAVQEPAVETKPVEEVKPVEAGPVLSPAAPAVTEQAAKAKAKPKAEPEVEDGVSVEMAYLNDIRASGKDHQKRILTALENLVETLTPGRPLSPKDGVVAQNLFLDYLVWALDREDPVVFKEVWSTLLVGFKVYHGEKNSPSRGYSSLSEYRAGAFTADWTDEERLATYLNLITLLRHTRNVSTRAHDIKKINLSALPDTYVGGARLERLKRFYGI